MTPAPTPARRGRRAGLRATVAVLTVALGAGGCGSGRTRTPETVLPTAAPGPSTASTTAPAPTTGTSTTTSTVARPVVAAPVRVNIGFLGTDAAAGGDPTLGPSVENGERLAVSQFTSDHPNLIVTIDPVALGAISAAAGAQRLIAAGVVAVIGPELPSEARSALPALTAAGIPAVTATATASDLTQSGWSLFRVVADDRQQGIDAAAELVTSLHLTSLGVLAGDVGGAATRTAWLSSEATQLGATVVDEPGLVTATTAAGVARAAVGSGVAGVYFSGPDAVAQLLVSDLIADGYQGVVLIAAGGAASVLAPLGSTADGVYVASAADDPAAIAAHGGNGLVFDDAFRAAFGSDPPVWAAEAYDATDVVLQAIAAGATTGPAVSAYVFNHTWNGVTGLLSFDSSGDQVNPPIFVSRIENGVPVQIAVTSQASS
jgi:branched-chain amino acid transport system substrate-binding protein